MSRTLLRPALATVLLATLLLFGRLAVAGATSVEDSLAGALAPSGAPALLGPITSAGRVGWECRSERAASAPRWQEAELPVSPGTP